MALKKYPADQGMVSAENLILTINANVDNDKLSDSEFREFVRNGMSICKEINEQEEKG